MLRRLHPDQPESFEFTPENRRWAEAQLTKYPEGREASAVLAILWRAQEQEGWLSRAAIEHAAAMCGMAYIRALEVATFYFMFQLQPVGSVAHVQVCGTTSCMICGAEDLIGVCKEKIASRPHELSRDGKFSWEEVECLGACSNAPMAQIGKDYYEDLTAESLADLLDRMEAGEVPKPGSQIGRFASEPADGKTVLLKDRVNEHNASVGLALEFGDTLKRIDGTEQPLRAPWNPVMDSPAKVPPAVNDDLMPPTAGAGSDEPTPGAQPSKDTPVSDTGTMKQETDADSTGRPDEGAVAGTEVDDQSTPMSDRSEPAGSSSQAGEEPDDRESSTHSGAGPLSADGPRSGGDDDAGAEARKPETLEGPRDGAGDDLKRIKGIGPKLEKMLHGLGIYHFDQIAGWSAEEVAWVDRNLEGFSGRVSRDDWTGQAKDLSSDGQTRD
jgi:NADH-quinone oxidoreductase subunit E